MIKYFDDTTEETLASLEKTQKDFWNIPRKTAVLINTFIKMMGAKSVLEIGTSNGYSGIWIAKALKQTGGKLTTIEFYEKRQSVAIENFKKCGVNDIIRPIQGSACDVIESFAPEEKFDFVFIDASKREYVKYFELIKPHLTEKALIIATVDDIQNHIDEIKVAKKIGVVIQTTQKTENLQNILSAVSQYAKELKVYNTICQTTSNRQKEAKTLAKEVDLMIVVGSKTSANTSHLAEILKEAALVIETLIKNNNTYVLNFFYPEIFGELYIVVQASVTLVGVIMLFVIIFLKLVLLMFLFQIHYFVATYLYFLDSHIYIEWDLYL